MLTSEHKKPGAIKSMLVAAGTAAALMAGSGAQALTLVLDFTSTQVTDGTNVVTAANYSSLFGFTTMNTNQFLSAVTATVRNDYLGYPTSATNVESLLAPGKELNLNVEFTTNHSAPTNGDAEYYFMGIGSDLDMTNQTGEACYGCVRRINSHGVAVGPSYGTASGDTIGTVWANVIADAYDGVQSDPDYGPLTDAQRVLFMAGTISHEFGHSLYIDHPGGPTDNPGDSPFSLMGTGADPTPMYDQERRLDRAFSYAEFATLISTVGVRDISAAPVPEPSSAMLMALGVFGLAARNRKAKRAVL